MTSLIRKGKAFLIFSTVVVLSLSRSDAFSILSASRAAAATHRSAESSTTSIAMTNEDIPDPATFREAEVLALLLMQEGRHDDAIIAFQKGMKLPGSRNPDMIRSRNVSGVSPVGGSFGGTSSQEANRLSNNELQSAYYNMACCNSRLGKVEEAVVNLEKAFQSGFDKYDTVRGDPDLDPIKQSRDYQKMMDTYDPPGFNPFGLFKK
ncbi:unnamed protein product [Pseudo-nitzschia multistriata]|uniref:Uncharacterized protein n=1 Tax=Pseudo-nitzschia multistriata TaxID=183589 RepID=A0A448ZBG7_9STRA|nr:unnamed protein product [Pseudo-nitzschia multistriata]